MYDDEVNLKISRLIDGDLGDDETLVLLKKMQSDEKLKHRMSRYQAISQALKTDEFYQVKSDFSHQVFQEIQREPAYLLPQLKSQSPNQPQQGRLKRNSIYAIAASTVVAAVLVGQSLRDNPAANQVQTMTAMSVSPQPLPSSLTKKQPNRQPLNTQFNEYLQAHNSSVYTNGEANFQPYAKVTSYGQR